MDLPDTLPQRMYLLAYDPAKGRTRAGGHLGRLVRAAALTDLYLNGHLADDRGKPVVDVRHPCHDPVLDALLEEISTSRPRRWQHWVGRRTRQAENAVRDQLAKEGWIRLERRKILGLLPVAKVTPRDPRVRKRLTGRVSSALQTPVNRVDPADAALVALSAASSLRVVLDRRASRAHKTRINDLTERCGPAPVALKKAIAAAVSSSAAG